jgi:DNA polymerase III subunit gamma/tau
MSEAPAQKAVARGAEPQEAGYRVLARKYRPSTFGELIGQEAMVRTLKNAFQQNRIAQAYVLTGVRGVGKTTTARILARALNYEPMEGGGVPTLDMPSFGRHCQAIMESRHVDVLEMDAASHTGIDDVRDILDGVRYAPVLARTKVYIIDEVHMLSEKAFNAFLKTLEEPPPHVKFIFATTEIRKVPVTVLSRCQRFDLRRVDAGVITEHLASIAEKEHVKAEPEALALIARATEGSVRDSLSLLDQAIAHGGAEVKAEEVRSMLGLADRTRVIDLFEALMRGDIAAALSEFRDQYDTGADPAVVVTDLAEFTHLLTRFKIVPEAADDRSLIQAERERGRVLAEKLSVRVLTRAWQMLLKGAYEVANAGKPAQAAEMLLVRIAYAADLPTPDEALRALQEGGGAETSARAASGPAPSARPDPGPRMAMAAEGGSRAQSAPAPARALAPEPAPASAPRLSSLADVAALAGAKRDLAIKHAVENFLRPGPIEEGRLEVGLVKGAPGNLATLLAAKLSEWTGRRWLVGISDSASGETLAEAAAKKQDKLKRDVRHDPLVEAVLTRFPGAEIVGVRPAADVPEESESTLPPDELIEDDR